MLYRFGDHLLDTARFELSRKGQVVPVEAQVFKLLVFLIENRDRAVTREELQQKLWGRRLVTDNALNVRIRAARIAIRDSGKAPAAIKTIRGAGYRFMADVDSTSHRTTSIGEATVGATLSRPEETARHPERALAGQPTIVVLPFQSVSSHPSEGVVSCGLAHDIITRLARSRLMFVIARGTAFNLSTGEQDVAQIGKRVGARYVVQGAVQISSTRLKVTVALANAHTRRELWSEQYHRSIDDFMLIQEEIAGMIVGALESEVQREEVQLSRLMPSTNLDAWGAYHRGLHYMYKFRYDECEKAEHFFRRSIDLEPDVPRPYAGLSFINFERVFLGFEKNRSRGICKAVDYATQGLAIDPSDPMAHWAMARAQLLKGELDAARQSLETAVELNPSYAIAQYSPGWVALRLGDNAFCCDRIDVARRLSPCDPLQFAMLGVYGLSLAMMGRTKEATGFAVKSLKQPNAHHQVLAFAALTHALAGQLDRASDYLRRLRAASPGYGLEDFLTVFRFSKEADRRRISKAFDEMQAGRRMH
jgi:TolB-like protein/Tfp pilus assembly protein PilF